MSDAKTYPLTATQVHALRDVDRDFRLAGEARASVVQEILAALGLPPTSRIDVNLDAGIATLRPEEPEEA